MLPFPLRHAKREDLFHASQILPVTLLGWLYLLREHVSLGEATHARQGAEPGAAG